jgi:hypothetical protein
MRSSSHTHPIARDELAGRDVLGALEPADSVSVERGRFFELAAGGLGQPDQYQPGGDQRKDRRSPHRRTPSKTLGRDTQQYRRKDVPDPPDAVIRPAKRVAAECRGKELGVE